MTDDLERKILAPYAHGNSYQSIREHLKDYYDIDFSNGTLNAVTHKFLPEFESWRERDLNLIYPIVWLDAIHYKIKENGRFISKAVYAVLALNSEGKKRAAGAVSIRYRGAHYWLSVLTDLQNRGIKDIYIACVDGLTGFPEAIEMIYPYAEVQLYIVHQIRNSMKYIGYKSQKPFMADLKAVYRTSTNNAAEIALNELESE